MPKHTDDSGKCKLAVTDRFPSQGNPCDVCEGGPCKFASGPPSTKGGGGGPKKRPKTRPYPQKRAYPRLDTRTEEDSYLTGFYQIYRKYEGDLTTFPLNPSPGLGEWEWRYAFAQKPTGGNSIYHAKIAISEHAPSDTAMTYVQWDDGYTDIERGRIYTYSIPSRQLVQLAGERLWARLGLYSYSPDLPDYPKDALSQDLPSVRAKALSTMTPSLSTGFSLPNFLYELKDFTSMFDSNFVHKIAQQRVLAARTLSKPLREISSDLASAKLTYDFAILPTISDLQKLLNILSTFSAKTSQFLEDAERLEAVRHYRAACSPSENIIGWVRELEAPLSVTLQPGAFYITCDINPSFEPQAHESGSVDAGKYSYSATMLYDYYVHKICEIHSQVLGLLNQLGVKPDASILWNAIPFSFLVDWFVDVGGFLRKHASLDVIDAQVNIHDWTESVRMRLTWTPTIKVSTPLWGSIVIAPNPELTSSLRGQVYMRYQASPDISNLDIQSKDGFTMNRAALSAALIRKSVFR